MIPLSTGDIIRIYVQGLSSDKLVSINTTWFDLSIASASAVGSIPTNPLLTNDSRIPDMIASASSVASITGTSASTIADAVWDEQLTGATHNIPTSSGRRLRQLAPTAILDGVITSATINSISFDGDASTINGAYDPAMVTIMSGSGIGQTRLIYQYDGSTKTAWVDRDWKVIPESGNTCVLASDAGREHVNEGVIRSASSLSVQLNTNASTQDGEYVGQVIFIRSGTGSDQARRIITYDGVNQIASTRRPWNPILDTTSVYVMLPTAELDVDRFIDSIWNEDLSGHTIPETSGSILYTRASASSLNGITGTSASTIWEYSNRTLTSASSILTVAIEGGYNLQQILQIMISVLAGKMDGSNTGTLTFRDLTDTIDRIAVEVNGLAERTGVTINV